MRRIIIWCGLGIMLAAMYAQAPASQSINCEVTVREKMAGDSDKYVLIEKKDFPVAEGVKNTTFITNFTLDMTAAYNDSGYFDCEISIFTLGPQTQTFFKKFQSEPGGVYFIDNIRCKDNVVYRVGISPVSVNSTTDDDNSCDFDFRKDGVWNFDPSANFDFYFVPQTLADARWNLLRDFMEKNFKEYKELFKIAFPGKINCFLSPCVLPEVTWDSRMGYAIDPPRANCFVLYSHDYNTVDPLPAYLLRLYRFLGYAPPILAEGMAAYFEFPHFYARQLYRGNKLPPIPQMIKSIDYYALPGNDNISAASSFCKYLIDTYGLSKFKVLYKNASDLNLEEQLETMYGKPLDSLESGWHAVLDTITFKYGILQYFYEREMYINREPGMNLFLGEMQKKMKTYDDTNYVWSQEGWNLYMRGDYDTSRTLYESLLKIAPTNNNYLIIYGNLLLIDGQYDSALTMYNRLLKVDSTIKTALNKMGQTFYWEDKIDSAHFYLLRDIDEDPSQLSKASSAILLGELALTEGDTTAATDYYNQALAFMDQIYQFGKTWPAYLLRIGEAHLGLAMCGTEDLSAAQQYLESGLYFEVHPTRVIFLTRILKELGKLADLQGRRDDALAYYQQALSFPLPPAFEAEVRQYVASPFKGYGR